MFEHRDNWGVFEPAIVMKFGERFRYFVIHLSKLLTIYMGDNYLLNEYLYY